jgi:predicted lipoprotein with Yx(FWY)xxD motif
VTRSSVQTALSTPRLAVPLAITVAFVGFGILFAVGGSPPREGRGAAAARAPTVTLRQSKLGRILVDAHGRTLYLFLEDAHGKSTCYEACARVWPALLASGRPRAGAGIDAAKLTTTKRRHSRLRQVVYNGHPLYTTDADAGPGDTAGQGFLGTWFVVSRHGNLIGKPSKSAGGY